MEYGKTLNTNILCRVTSSKKITATLKTIGVPVWNYLFEDGSEDDYKYIYWHEDTCEVCAIDDFDRDDVEISLEEFICRLFNNWDEVLIIDGKRYKLID